MFIVTSAHFVCFERGCPEAEHAHDKHCTQVTVIARPTAVLAAEGPRATTEPDRSDRIFSIVPKQQGKAPRAERHRMTDYMLVHRQRRCLFAWDTMM